MEVLKRILRRIFCKHDYLFEAEVVAVDVDRGITERTLICNCGKCGKPNRFFYKTTFGKPFDS